MYSVKPTSCQIFAKIVDAISILAQQAVVPKYYSMTFSSVVLSKTFWRNWRDWTYGPYIFARLFGNLGENQVRFNFHLDATTLGKFMRLTIIFVTLRKFCHDPLQICLEFCHYVLELQIQLGFCKHLQEIAHFLTLQMAKKKWAKVIILLHIISAYSRGGSRTAATSKMELFVLHLGCLQQPQISFCYSYQL